MSAGAGARLSRRLLSVDQRVVAAAFFATNTVPAGEFSIPEFKRFIKLWGQRFARAFPDHFAYWVIELTEKLTPHLHLIIGWVKGKPAPSLKEFRTWNDDAWADTVKSIHPMHRVVSCNVEPVERWGGATRYLAGYLKKGRLQHGEIETGRMWGCVGEVNVPRSWSEVRLTRQQGQFVLRSLRRHRQSKVVWLHAITSEDNSRSWKRVSVKGASRSFGRPVRSLDEALGFYRAYGHGLRKIRPKVFRRETITVWSEDEDTGKLEKRGGADGAETEIYSAAFSWYYVGGDVVSRLVQLALTQFPEGGFS